MGGFDGMQQRGLAVLQDGLSPLPKELTHSDSVPISYWNSDLGGAVQFLFFAEDSEGVFHPADLTFQYSRSVDGWHPINTPRFWTADCTDAIGDPNFMRSDAHGVIETSSSSVETVPEPGRPAIVMSGFHAPEVAEIWLVRANRVDKRPASGHFGSWTICVDKRPASGHFGSWTICTELYAPLRVEAHDAAGVLLGVADGPHPILELH